MWCPALLRRHPPDRDGSVVDDERRAADAEGVEAVQLPTSIQLGRVVVKGQPGTRRLVNRVGERTVSPRRLDRIVVEIRDDSVRPRR
jgi:hypothetical protein